MRKRIAVKNKKYKYISSLLNGFLLLLLFTGLVYAQGERWVYTYNGPGNEDDVANSIAYDADGNIYAAGYSTGSGTGKDFIIISLRNSGDTNWVYRYNGPGNGDDVANSIVYGADDNIYAAGYSEGLGTNCDFTVISLTPSGDENWVYRYIGYGDGRDIANSIAFGADFNIYVGGMAVGTDDTTAIPYLTVISLTGSGYVNWIYRYDDPENSSGGVATSIIYGADDNIYAAGALDLSVCMTTILGVISFNTSGDTNWTYKCGPESGLPGIANSIVYGADGNIYVAGHTGVWWDQDFTVISIDTTGAENWVYIYDGPHPGEYEEVANSIAYGADGNVYVAGTSQGSFTGSDFTVISFTTDGDTNWVYLYNGFEDYWDAANSIVYGLDGNIYATGYSAGSTGYDFTVISLKTSGNTNWIYRYNGFEDGNDIANAIVYGKDGNLYAAGYSYGGATDNDFTVISLDPISSVEEYSPAPRPEGNFELLSSFFNNEISVRFANSSSFPLKIALYNILGAQVYETSFSNTPFSLCLKDKSISRLPKGIYFLSISQDSKYYPVTKLIKPR